MKTEGNDEAGADDAGQLDAVTVASETMLGDLIQTVRQELASAPDLWQKMSEDEQVKVLERVEKRMRASIDQAVRIIASDGRPTVAAKLESLTVKDGLKATLKLAPGTLESHALMDATGSRVMILLVDPDKYNGGAVDAMKPDPNQGALHLENSATDATADLLGRLANDPNHKPVMGDKDDTELQTRLRAALCGEVPTATIAAWTFNQRMEAKEWADRFIAHINSGDGADDVTNIPAWLAEIVGDIAQPKTLFAVTDNSGAGELPSGVWATSADKAVEYYRVALKLTDDVEVGVRKPKKAEQKSLSIMNPQDAPKEK